LTATRLASYTSSFDYTIDDGNGGGGGGGSSSSSSSSSSNRVYIQISGMVTCRRTK